jgi:hypothetical protein
MLIVKTIKISFSCAFIYVTLLACSERSNLNIKAVEQPPKEEKDNGGQIKEPTLHASKEAQAREAFRAVSAKLGSRGTVKFNTSMTAIYQSTVPRLPFLQDDPSSRSFFPASPGLVAELGAAFVPKLPQKIQDKLHEYNIENKNINVAFIVQSNQNLGEPSDHDNIPTKTSLKAHGWLDPEAPANYEGTRVNREVLLGIFASEGNIHYPGGVPYENLANSPVHTHDGVLSPRTQSNKVAIGANSPSMSFWSLAIDHEEGKEKRAIATLHWVLASKGNPSDFIQFTDLIIKYTSKGIAELKLTNFGQFLTIIKEAPAFKNRRFVKTLTDLFD